MKTVLKTLICLIKGHKWEAFYRGRNKICARCETVISFCGEYGSDYCGPSLGEDGVFICKRKSNKLNTPDLLRK